MGFSNSGNKASHSRGNRLDEVITSEHVRNSVNFMSVVTRQSWGLSRGLMVAISLAFLYAFVQGIRQDIGIFKSIILVYVIAGLVYAVARTVSFVFSKTAAPTPWIAAVLCRSTLKTTNEPVMDQSFAGLRSPILVFSIAFLLVAPGFAGTPGEQSESAAESRWVPGAGPFSLVDHTGQPTTDKKFRGEYMLVYFGYTHCPDICPTALGIMTQAVRQLGNDGAQVRPVFISVDWRRDTVDVLARYVGAFHPRLVGLTGTQEQIHQATTSYGVLYMIAKVRGEYSVFHSGFTYLVGPDGNILEAFPTDINAEGMTEAIRGYLSQEEEKEKTT
jgi:protein SCO1/2